MYIEEGQTTQWPKEKVQIDKQRSTKHTYKTKDRWNKLHQTLGTKAPI
jgi:ribonuclease HI